MAMELLFSIPLEECEQPYAEQAMDYGGVFGAVDGTLRRGAWGCMIRFARNIHKKFSLSLLSEGQRYGILYQLGEIFTQNFDL